MMLRKLQKKHEPLYALSGFGPGFLNLFLAIYIENALNGSAGVISYDPNNTKSTIIIVGIYTALLVVGRVIDALLNIPMAAVSDNFKTKWGRRRPAILIGLLLTTVAYVAMACPWFHINPNDSEKLFNTLYFFLFFLLYLFAYSLCMVTYYATIPEITTDPQSRTRLTHWKAAFDTINYSAAYALLPLIFNFWPQIFWLGLAFTPLIFTMVIPLLMIKEPPSYLIVHDAENRKIKKSTTNEVISAKASFKNFKESLKVSFSNRNYIWWILLFSLFFFGLDLFLLSQTSIASHSMGMSPIEITIMNSMAFAPISIMLLLSNKITKVKGFKFTFCLAILSFIFAMSIFLIAYKNWGMSDAIILILGLTGSLIGSFGIGTFFMFPYMVPAQIAAEEAQKTGKSNSAMFYGVQGTLVSISSALNDPVWLPIAHIGETGTDDNIKYNTSGEIGPHIIIYIILSVCIMAFIASLFLPKYFKSMGRVCNTKLKYDS